jgi:hypothetical protein
VTVPEHPLRRLGPDAGRERPVRLEVVDRLNAIGHLAEHAAGGELDPELAVDGIAQHLDHLRHWLKAVAA